MIACTNVSNHICRAVEGVSLSAGSQSYQSFNEALDVYHDVCAMMSEHVVVVVECQRGVKCSRGVISVWCA